MAGIGDLHSLAVLLLQSCAEALDTIPSYDATLLGAPDRQFVSPGQPVDDCCEQLAVHIPAVGQANTSPTGLASGKRHLFGAINHVALSVRITRCIPNGMNAQSGVYTPPSPVSLTEAARQLNADAWALWNHLFNLQSSDLLLSLCDEVFFDGIGAIPPSGGCGGWVLQMHCSLGGYQEVFGT